MHTTTFTMLTSTNTQRIRHINSHSVTSLLCSFCSRNIIILCFSHQHHSCKCSYKFSGTALLKGNFRIRFPKLLVIKFSIKFYSTQLFSKLSTVLKIIFIKPRLEIMQNTLHTKKTLNLEWNALVTRGLSLSSEMTSVFRTHQQHRVFPSTQNENVLREKYHFKQLIRACFSLTTSAPNVRVWFAQLYVRLEYLFILFRSSY